VTGRSAGHEWSATITAHDGGQADAALVQRFRQSQTTRERTAVFADVLRQHRHAVLSCCAERLWPDADAAVAAAAGVLVAARLAMADPARRPRPDRLRDWLLGIAAQACPKPGQPARIDDVDWAAVRARIAVGTRAMPDSPVTLEPLRHWLERIVATLPEPRQRMYDLFVVRGLDSRNAALELGTTVAEVRRLRRENRQAILRAFEVTALAAAEAAVGPTSIGAPGCGELRQMLADPRSDGDPHEDGRRHPVVLSAAVRLTLSRHLSECQACQDRRDGCMARWAPELLPILADAELHEQVMDDLSSTPELRQPGAVPGAHRRVAPAGTATKVVIGRSAVAVGAGLGPRREARATGPSEGGRPIEHTSADGDREPGCFLVRVSAAIGVLHGSACNGANVVPHAAGFPVAIVAAVTNDVTDAEPVYLHADADGVYHHADAQPERVWLHADAHGERIRARADAERVCLRYLGADAHCFRVGLGTDFGIAHGVVDGSAVGVSHLLDPTSRPRAMPSA
jgi:hypothetical protein